MLSGVAAVLFGAGTTAAALIFYALFNSGQQPSLDAFRNGLAIHSFKNTQGFFGCIAHHKAVGALADVPVKLG